MSNKNEVFEYLIDQLRQQVSNGPYKQQCEGLAHEVLSLKNQLRDASALVAELQKELDTANNTVVRLRKEIAKSTGDVQDYIDATEQSGCRKEDTQECKHSWIIMPGLFLSEGNPNNVPGSELCCKCGKREWDVKGYKPKDDTQECKHVWCAKTFYGTLVPPMYCRKCGATK